MVGAKNVDEIPVAPAQLVGVIRGVGAEIRRPPIAAHEHAIFIISKFGRTQPQRTILFVDMAAGAQILDGCSNGSRFVQRRLVSPVVEMNAKAFEIGALLLDDEISSEPP